MKLIGYRQDSTTVEIPEKVFQVDGYSVGDTWLEGVMFNVDFTDEQNLKITVEKRSEPYFNKFNIEMYLEGVKDYAIRQLEGDEVIVSAEIMKKYNIVAAAIE